MLLLKLVSAPWTLPCMEKESKILFDELRSHREQRQISEYISCAVIVCLPELEDISAVDLRENFVFKVNISVFEYSILLTIGKYLLLVYRR